MSKISGPLLDRIDIHIEVPAVSYQELSTSQPGTSSREMCDVVRQARDRQTARFVGHPRTRANSQMNSREIREFCQLDKACRELLKQSVADLGLSARAHDKVLRVARTIADLEQQEAIQTEHLQEAVNYRMLDRQIWT
jgi:magnesium chelatase family protein